MGLWCYRLYARNFPESAYLLGFLPKYIGQYNKKLEKKCIGIGVHMERLHGMLDKLEDLYKNHYKPHINFCDCQVSLTYQTFIQFRKEVRKDYAAAKRAARKHFKERNLRV